MALKIKMVRLGTKHKPHYKIVVASREKSRNSNFIEQLGIYSPNFHPPLFKIDRKRTDYWLKMGARPTEAVENIFKREKII
ncbi:MAG: 30S ribosomal protein S16 [Candidatus Omnitrophica bacterium]|nr:30S ribosomal protein S16 [Candidatus Omnitrophota bacterium]MCM8793362.1 30S ribosomal protein S16 [Candidatus Omnitrophota bacterium]